MFAVTGDLIDALELTVRPAGEADRGAAMGDTLVIPEGTTVRVELRVRQPTQPNFNGQRPALDHIELIVGTGRGAGGPQMQIKRFGPAD